MLIYFVLFFVFLTFLHFSIRYSRAGRMLNKIPGPFNIPLIGSLYIFNDKSQRGTWLTIRNLSDLYYPIFKGYMFHKPIVAVRRPEDLEVVLTSPKCSHKDYPYIYLRSWLGNGIFSNEGETHKNRRKMLTPVFHFNMLKRYITIMNEQSDGFINELRDKGNEFVTDIMHLFTNVSLSIIIEAAMGVEFHKNNKEYAMKYKEALQEMGCILIHRMFRPHILDFMLNSWTSIGRRQNKALDTFRGLTNKIIDERKKYLEKNGQIQGFKEFTESLEIQESNSIYNTDSKKKLPMLDMLLAMQRDGLIDDVGLREEVDTFLFGGTDTTRATLAFFTMIIAENKDAQEKARAEVCAVLDESGGLIGVAELQRLPYLEQCIKESMRMYPIGSTLFRYTIGDVQLKNYVIPAGVNVVCQIFDAHRDPDFWIEPEKYDPDRFSPENSKNRHPFAFLPFSAGSRNCIGQKFGMMEIKSVCARLLYNFILEPIDRSTDMKLISDIVLQPADPIHTKFIRIERKLFSNNNMKIQ